MPIAVISVSRCVGNIRSIVGRRLHFSGKNGHTTIAGIWLYASALVILAF